MSDLYRIRWDAAATIGAPLIVEDKQHGKLGVLVPATDERLTRAEWEAATQLPSRDNLRDIAEMRPRTVTLHLTTGATEYMTDEEIADEVATIIELTDDTPLQCVGITLPREEG